MFEASYYGILATRKLVSCAGVGVQGSQRYLSLCLGVYSTTVPLYNLSCIIETLIHEFHDFIMSAICDYRPSDPSRRREK